MPSTPSAIPRPLSLVRFDAARLSTESAAAYPFQTDALFIYLGEIPNMPGHCVVAEQSSGRICAGFHTECFIELSEDEV